MDDSHASALIVRFRDWRLRHAALMERLNHALEKLSIWVGTVKQETLQSTEPLSGSPQTRSERIETVSTRIRSLEAITEVVPKVQRLVLSISGSMHEMSARLIDAREDGTLNDGLLDEGDEVLSSAERSILALEEGMMSLPDR